MSDLTIKHWGESPIQRMQKAIEAFKNGNGVLVLDNEDRENEGDLIFPAETITVKQMAKLIRYGSGIVCLTITEQLRQKMKIPMMTSNNQSVNKTAFTVSIEAASGIHTGVSAADRVTTIQAFINSNATPSDIHVPGHVYPLVANSMGVLGRQGHTEASVDLAKLAGYSSTGVICEITNDDGSMAKAPDIYKFGLEHGYPVITIEDMIVYIEQLNQKMTMNDNIA